VPSLFAGIGFIAVAANVVKRRSTMLLLPVVWMILMIAAYGRNLPMLYQNGRYLMPILPAFLLLSLDGIKKVMDFFRNRIDLLKNGYAAECATGIITALIIVIFAAKSFDQQTEYAAACKYIADRQVKTAFWIRDHLPADAVVATHDIGAIAYYSGRRVVDMVGLVSPEMIDNIGRYDLLMKFLIHNRPTHLAVLRNWFEIVNQNPLFQTDPAYPEIMEVFLFDPARLHFMQQQASRLDDAGEYFLSRGDALYARQYFQQSLLIDPRSARTHVLLGRAARILGDTAAAHLQFTAANMLQPDYPGLSEDILPFNTRRPR
jgi:tetratricopeptide (TPR) repeat protein